MTATNPLSGLAAAELAALLAPVSNSLASIKATPTSLNVILQLTSLQSSLINAAPVLESVGISGLAGFLQDKLAEFQAKLTASAASGGSASAAPVAASLGAA